jgi:hypothetical protein
VGSIPHESKVIMRKPDTWIRPALRASGFHRKRQCGVPSSYEKRKEIKNNRGLLLPPMPSGIVRGGAAGGGGVSLALTK